ncbi:ankyrin repeat-containing domain protein [Aspergillus lucknowensis]|uniref:Ankyrin repeat-containing domain protein n=1 Tax=Aspergillus lucknowensis TaxID=176173 RepID=A0ABR4LSQ2_9EURO
MAIRSNMATPRVRLTHKDYTVGWVCALAKETVAATAMLDELHLALPQPASDSNNYTLGRVGDHNVVIACLPIGEMGNNSSATVATRLTSTFPAIRFGLMVGIGGGVPSAVRLGDVVVSTPGDGYGGVVQWDFGKTEQDHGFRRIGSLDSPPTVLKTALSTLKVRHEMEGSRIPAFLHEVEKKWPRLVPKYTRREGLNDVVFPANCEHLEATSTPVPQRQENDDYRECLGCDRDRAIRRELRDIQVHYGLIASGNQVVKDGAFRDQINARLGGRVLCFEMEAAGLMNEFRCVVVRGICDYADSHKNKRWQEYAATVAAAMAKEILLTVPVREVDEMSPVARISDHVEGIHLDMTDIKEVLQDIVDREILQRISNTDSSLDHARARSKHTATTGQWLLDDHVYKRWVDGEFQVLGIYGIPGSGKTILCSTVVDHLYQTYRNDTKTKIAYFYFDSAPSEKSTVEGCVRNLLRQLLAPRLSENTRALYSRAEAHTHPALGAVLRALREAVAPADRVYLIVDALDECESVQLFMEILVEVKSLSKVHVLVASRPNNMMQRAVPALVEETIYLDAPRVEQDIRTFVTARLYRDSSLSRRWSEEQRKDICEAVVTKSAGMFQLAACQLHEFERCYSRHDLEVVLGKLPQTLSAIYERMLRQIPLHARARAKTLLLWLCFSARPLSLDEAAELFAIDFGGRSPRLDAARRLLDPLDILSICPGLITLTAIGASGSDSGENVVVQLAHSSVKEYLISQDIRDYGIRDLVAAHRVIAETCLEYILLLDNTTSLTPSILKEYPLIRYAAEFWPTHALCSSISPGSRLQIMLEDIFIFRHEALLNWIRIHDHDEPWRTQKRPLDSTFAGLLPSPLYYASLTGLDTVVACILANEPEIPEGEGLYGSAVNAAAGRGRLRVLQLLLDYGMPIDKEGLYGNALHTAAFGGHAAVCKFLVERGADVDAPGEDFSNALEGAIYGDHPEVVKVLLDRGADITAPGRCYADCLHTACTLGNREIVRMLLQKREIDSLGASYNRALQAATDRNFRHILELLRQYAPTMATRDPSYGSALHTAAANSYARIVELLLNQGADVDSIEEEHGTALCIAASIGDEEIIRLLVGRGANLEAEGSAGTALHIASSRGHTTIVRLLLDKGANPNSRGGHFGTPLQAACYKGNLDIAELLLNAGADVNAFAGEYGYAIHAAATGLSSQVETVKLLLDRGARVDVYKEWYGTPLQVALLSRNHEVAQMLREYGA